MQAITEVKKMSYSIPSFTKLFVSYLIEEKEIEVSKSDCLLKIIIIISTLLGRNTGDPVVYSVFNTSADNVISSLSSLSIF